MVHLNIGNGLHNFLYSGDIKFSKTRALDGATSYFPRLETFLIESTYGGKDNNYPPRKEAEQTLLDFINEVVKNGGKLLLPELGTGHAQEKMLILVDAMETGKIPKVPVYIDGMIWDINAIHTAYPDFLSNAVRSQIFAGNNPFTNEIFKQVGSPHERKAVIEGGPCIILATSGMLVGGASVEYLREFADNPNNGLCLSCYQPAGGLGRQLQDGIRNVTFNVNGKEERTEVKMKFLSMEGFSGHCSRSELMALMNQIQPKPKRVIVNHGEQSRALDFASSIYKSHRIETVVPKNLETVRLR